MFTLKKDKIETFDFKVEGSKVTYKVPLLRYLTMDEAMAAKELANASEEDAMVFVVNLFEKYAPGVVGTLTGNEFGELSQAYFDASGVTLGE